MLFLGHVLMENSNAAVRQPLIYLAVKRNNGSGRLTVRWNRF